MNRNKYHKPNFVLIRPLLLEGQCSQLPKKKMHIKIEELKSDLGTLKGFELSIGRMTEKAPAEEVGPTPFPSTTDLREWDFKLLEKYKPFYMPFCDVCCLCTFGKCDLSQGKRGACGLDMAAQQSRIVLLACCIGAATHLAHARHLLEHLIENFGRDCKIDVGGLNVEVEAPVTRLVCGIKPETLEDLEEVLDYCETEVTHLLSATHTGQEGSNIDFESKVFHAGMIDQVSMEVADMAQVSAYGFPKADPEASLVETGFGVVDAKKPVIMVVGHNVPPAVEIVNYLQENGLQGMVEVTGLCCTAHDITRYNPKAKIVGPISWQLRYIRSGIPDVVVVDEQCIRADAFNEAKKIKAPLIASSPKNCLGLPNRTHDKTDAVVADLVSGKTPGVLILDPKKVGEVAAKVAVLVAPKRKKFKAMPSVKKVVESAKRCTRCYECVRACPNDLPILEAVTEAAKGNLKKLADLYDGCIGCARCESACSKELPIHSFIVKAAEKKMKKETYLVRAGRGAIQDVEIRNVGGPIVLGEIPGVVAFVGCANYPNGGKEVAEMAMEFAKRRFIVVTSGCAAMSAGMYKDKEGKSPYEIYPGVFDAGGILNVGSCVSNSHIAGAAIKIASIFAKRRLLGNYEEIADYIHNRVGAVGVAWGAMSQKAASIASGFWRLGVPVIVGPHGSKYRRMLLGRKDREEDWHVYDARTGDRVYGGPSPEHLFYAAETKEEAMVMIAKLCMRPNDTTKGRAIKLTHYIDLSRRLYGTMPDDVHLFIRTHADVPITMKEEIVKILKEKRWKEWKIPDPTLLPRMIRKREEE
jgi:acetyl-CoA decarbonylase/synthase complex subunit alpha